MRLCALSDTHTLHRKLKPQDMPEADVLIFAGDLMGSGYRHEEVRDFGKWFSNQPYQFKILVAGNHDRLFEKDEKWCLEQFDKDVIYLKDSGVNIGGWNFWGSPYQPEFCSWAFNVPRGQLHKHWDLIPTNTDVLITHGPPFGILDTINGLPTGEHLGCPELLKRVQELKPPGNGYLIHFFGHIHGGAGMDVDTSLNIGYDNVSMCNERYELVHKPYIHGMWMHSDWNGPNEIAKELVLKPFQKE